MTSTFRVQLLEGLGFGEKHKTLELKQVNSGKVTGSRWSEPRGGEVMTAR